MVKFFLARIFAIAFLSRVGYNLKVKELLLFSACGSRFSVSEGVRERLRGRNPGDPAFPFLWMGKGDPGS